MNASDAISHRKQRVAARFARNARNYERHAQIQQRVAARLARLLPPLTAPDVLEIGCGTGFLTRHLLATYDDGDFLITDLAPAMLDVCAANTGRPANARFAVMDGEDPALPRACDLIASSMALQWFEDPLAGLARLRQRLKPGGHLVYACTGHDLFPQWRAVLEELGLQSGILDTPPLPGIIAEEREEMHFASGLEFLASLKEVGASEPQPAYRRLSPGELRRALRRFEEQAGSVASWHIVYGVLRG